MKRQSDHSDHARGSPGPAGEELERAVTLFRALGDAERLRLCGLLVAGERCVSELAVACDAALSTVSQRLRRLRSDGLVVRRRDGKHIYYRLADGHVGELVTNALAHAGEVSPRRGAGRKKERRS